MRSPPDATMTKTPAGFSVCARTAARHAARSPGRPVSVTMSAIPAAATSRAARAEPARGHDGNARGRDDRGDVGAPPRAVKPEAVPKAVGNPFREVLPDAEARGI